MFCNYEAPPPLSPAQRIRFSGMWDESVPRTDSPPPLRPPPVSTEQNAERVMQVVTSPAQRIIRGRAQSASRARATSAGRQRPASARNRRPPSARPPSARSRQPPVVAQNEPIEEASVGSLKGWDVSMGGSQDLGFVFSQLLDSTALKPTAAVEDLPSPDPTSPFSDGSHSEAGSSPSVATAASAPITNSNNRSIFQPPDARHWEPAVKKVRPVSAGMRSVSSARTAATEGGSRMQIAKQNAKREDAWDQRWDSNSTTAAGQGGRRPAWGGKESGDPSWQKQKTRKPETARPSVIYTSIGKGTGRNRTQGNLNGKPLPWLDPKKKIKRKPLVEGAPIIRRR